MKRPFDYTVSALRALNADTTGSRHPSRTWSGWANCLTNGRCRTATRTAPTCIPSLLARWNFALDLVQDKIPGHLDRSGSAGEGDGATAPSRRARGPSRRAAGAPLPEKQRSMKPANGSATRTAWRSAVPGVAAFHAAVPVAVNSRVWRATGTCGECGETLVIAAW